MEGAVQCQEPTLLHANGCSGSDGDSDADAGREWPVAVKRDPLLGEIYYGQALVKDIRDQSQDLHKGSHISKATQVMQALEAEDPLAEGPRPQ